MVDAMIERGRGDIERACGNYFAERPVPADDQATYVEAFSSAIGQLLGSIKAEVHRSIALNEAKGNVSRN